MDLKGLSKSYGDLNILKNTTATIERGDKIALIGANGKGKSTLLRILNGSEAVNGERKEGYNVIQGFYAQHQLEALHTENEIIEELMQAGSGKTELELRSVLGCFLFSGDDIYKRIKVLSGGEKSRVALAKTLISEANFLLLDEPTNHLDFISENILVQALQQYQGSFVIVSHNRHFITQVANKIWYIEDQQIKSYPGNYEAYQYWRSQQTEVRPGPEKQAVKKPEVAAPAPKESKPAGNKAAKRLEQVEKEISELETRRGELEAEMAKPEFYTDPTTSRVILSEHAEVVRKLEDHTRTWEALVEELS